MSPPRRPWPPVLSDARWLRFTVFTAFYLIQGFPIGLISIALPAWFIANGVSTGQVSAFVATTGLPWALKLFAGPFMDRFSFPPMGMRRPWVIAAQACLILVGCLLLLVGDPLEQFTLLLVVCTAMNAFAAIQDVAVDGMAITILHEEERGRANAFMAAGQVAGYSLTGALCAELLNAGGVPLAGGVIVAGIAVVACLSLLIRERAGERLLPWTEGRPHPDAPRPEGSALHLVKDLGKYLVLPMGVLMVVVEWLYRMAAGVNLVWFPDIAITSLGFTDTDYARWISISSAVSALFGLVVGVLIDKVGAKKVTLWGLLAGALFYAMLCPLANMLSHGAAAAAALLVSQLLSQVVFVSIIAIFMGICGVRVAATQFAIYMALANLARSAGAGVYPWLKDGFGLEGLFIPVSLLLLVAWFLTRRFDLRSHQQRLFALDPENRTDG